MCVDRCRSGVPQTNLDLSMADKANARPPLWARNNARKAIDLMDGTHVYISFLQAQSQTRQSILKIDTAANIRKYLQRMEKKGHVINSGHREFIAPCLGTIFELESGETERNVMLSKMKFEVKRTGVAIKSTAFMNVPQHAFGRIFERDLRPPAEVARAFTGRTFIENVLELHALGDPQASENSFAIRFFDGFLTGTVREFASWPDEVMSKALDVRTFLHARDKPESLIRN